MWALAFGSGGFMFYFGIKYIRKMQQANQARNGFDFTNALNMIMNEEGFRASPYWDVRQWTWGYGTAAGYDKNNKPQGTISKAQAEQDVITDLKKYYVQIYMKLNKPISDNQMTAMLDFTFNLGIGDTYKLITNINNGYTAQQTADEINMYVYAGGNFSQDLADRRKKESDLYLS